MTASNISCLDNGAKPIDIAKQYFNLSNQGDLDTIKSLLMKDATYSSAHSGLYFGREAIMDMMHDFFASYQTRQWHVNKVWEVNPLIIGFDFTFTGTHTGTHTGTDKGTEPRAVTRDGIEHIIIGHDGLIRHIEVRTKTEGSP